MAEARPIPPSRCKTPGERINYIRSERKAAFVEIDRLCGLAPGHTRTLLVRKSKGRADTLRKIATALGVPFEWLAFGTGPAPSRAAIRGGETAGDPQAAAPTEPAAAE